MLVRWVRQALRNLEQAHRYIAVDDPQSGRQLVLRVQGVEVASLPPAAVSVLKYPFCLALRAEKNHENRTF